MPLSRAEWDEVVAVQTVRDLWGLDADETGQLFCQHAYGVRFDFVSGGPGYCGDLFVIHGDSLGGPPVALIRDENHKLVLIDEY